MIGEFLLPGLVVVFLGMGALTVALGIYLSMISSIPEQLITFFISSLVYLFTIRLVVLRFVPSDSRKANIDEDHEAIGERAVVSEEILESGDGRIEYAGSHWKATSEDGQKIDLGESVTIVGRDNITWIVKKNI